MEPKNEWKHTGFQSCFISSSRDLVTRFHVRSLSYAKKKNINTSKSNGGLPTFMMFPINPYSAKGPWHKIKVWTLFFLSIKFKSLPLAVNSVYPFSPYLRFLFITPSFTRRPSFWPRDGRAISWASFRSHRHSWMWGSRACTWPTTAGHMGAEKVWKIRPRKTWRHIKLGVNNLVNGQ